MHRARQRLVSERDYLRIDREDAVRELDTQLSAPPAVSNVEKFLQAQMGVVAPDPARSPVVSALMVGTLERAQCNYDPSKVAYIYRGVGGNDIIARFPILADDPEVDAHVRGLVELVNSKLEAKWAEEFP